MSASRRLLTAFAATVAAYGLLLADVPVALAATNSDASAQGFQNGPGAAILFWLFAAGSLGGAIFVITRRNLVTAVMGMVGTFFAIAGLFLMLYASFLAVIQVLVYAGAIMVLFVFVVMILNRPEDEPWALKGLLGKTLASVGMLYLTVRLFQVLWAVKDDFGHLGKPLAMPPRTIIEHGERIVSTYEFGTVKGVGYTLFSDYLFPFEAVSLVLLVAVVGSIALVRPVKSQSASEQSEAVS